MCLHFMAMGMQIKQNTAAGSSLDMREPHWCLEPMRDHLKCIRPKLPELKKKLRSFCSAAGANLCMPWHKTFERITMALEKDAHGTSEKLKQSMIFLAESMKKFSTYKDAMDHMTKDRHGYFTLRELGKRGPILDYIIDANRDHKISPEEFKMFFKTLSVFTDHAYVFDKKNQHPLKIEKFLHLTTGARDVHHNP